MKQWFKIENKADKAEIWIYEAIGEDFWTGEGRTAKTFQKELAAITASQIDLHINSPGGEVFEGITIYNLLKQHQARVTTYIDGLAASIASVIALAGERIVMAENGLFMVHRASGLTMGTASDMRQMADLLEKIDGSIMKTYTNKTGKADDEVFLMMDAETWMTAEEAKDFGFVDEIGAKMDLAACAKFAPAMAKLGFKKIPDTIAAGKPFPSVRDLERVLHENGFSVKQAKEIIAKGYGPDLRDEGPDPTPRPTVIQRDVEEPRAAKIDRVAEAIKRADAASPKTL